MSVGQNGRGLGGGKGLHSLLNVSPKIGFRLTQRLCMLLLQSGLAGGNLGTSRLDASRLGLFVSKYFRHPGHRGGSGHHDRCGHTQDGDENG